jgi:DNA-cytosine methyltransferase
MKILSLFDGISCGRVAFERAGIAVSEYHACEIDKYATQISQRNYPDIVRHGSVVDYHPDKHFDYLIGGSSCQGFSFAGKGLAFDDPRSKLFFEYVRILEECRKYNPNIKFMLENVKMKKEHMDVITQYMGVEPVCINSSLLSAQNRVRYYWANWNISQPEDKGIFLKDIIEDGAVDREKSYCIDANYYKGGNPKSYFEKNRRQLVGVSQTANGLRPYKNDERKGLFSEIGTINLEDGKSSCLSTSHAPKLLVTDMADDKFGHDIQRRIYSVEGKSPALLSIETGGALPPKIQIAIGDKFIEGITYRKLTVTECERLQTLPDGYTRHVSNTQAYKGLGNGWTVDVIAHNLKESINERL